MRASRLRLLRNFPAGVFLGTLLGIFICWILVEQPVISTLISFPTLLTSLVSVGAAAIALMSALSAIDNQNGVAEDVRAAKLAAARSVLPIALSEIYTVCENRVQFGFDRRADRKQSDWLFSETTQKTLKECIEFSTEAPREGLVELVRVYQVLVARHMDATGYPNTRQLSDCNCWSNPVRYDRFHEIANWCTLQCLAELLFPFARGSSMTVHRSELTQKVASRLLNLHQSGSGWSISNAEGFRAWYDSRLKIGRFSFSEPGWHEDE